MEQDYYCRHFSLALPEGSGQDNVPRLLHKLAEAIEAQALDVIDIVFHNEIEDGKDRPYVTVYYVADTSGMVGS